MKNTKMGIIDKMFIGIFIIGTILFWLLFNLKAKPVPHEYFEGKIVNSYSCVVKDVVANEEANIQSDGSYILNQPKLNTVVFDIPELNITDGLLVSTAGVGDTINVTLLKNSKESKLFLTSSLAQPNSYYFIGDYDKYMEQRQADMNFFSFIIKIAFTFVFLVFIGLIDDAIMCKLRKRGELDKIEE